MVREAKGWSCSICHYHSVSKAAKTDVKRHVVSKHLNMKSRTAAHFMYSADPLQWISAITSLTVEILDVEDQIQVAGDQFSCIVCGRAFPKLWLCRRHIRTVHTEDQEVTCNICNRTLKNQGSLKTHLRGCHNIYQRMWILDFGFWIMCWSRGKGESSFYWIGSLLDVEDQIQAVGDHFCCGLCGRSFPKKITCRRHIRTVHSEDQEVLCHVCNKTLKNAGSLKAHLRGSHNIYQRMWDWLCFLCNSRLSIVSIKLLKLDIPCLVLKMFIV